MKKKYYVVIDHPKDKEIIESDHYAIRIGASEIDPANKVEVAIFKNQKKQEFKPCRQSEGYWWYDVFFSNYQPGNYKVVARIKKPSGRYLKSTPVSFTYKPKN